MGENVYVDNGTAIPAKKNSFFEKKIKGGWGMAKYEEEPPELMKKWHLAIILEGQWKIMLYFTWIWGDKLYRIKLTEKGAQNVHICVHFTVNLLLSNAIIEGFKTV